MKIVSGAQFAVKLSVPESQEYLTPERCHILELANDAADPAASVARARVEPGVTTVLHLVRGTLERYVILAGTGMAEIGSAAPVHVSVGDVVRILPNVPQRIHNTGNTDLVFLCICTPRFQWDNYEALE